MADGAEQRKGQVEGGLGRNWVRARVRTGLGASGLPRSGGRFIKQSVLYDWPEASPISHLDASQSRRFATDTRSRFDGTSSSSVAPPPSSALPPSPLLRAFLVPCFSLFFHPSASASASASGCFCVVSPPPCARRSRREEKQRGHGLSTNYSLQHCSSHAMITTYRSAVAPRENKTPLFRTWKRV